MKILVISHMYPSSVNPTYGIFVHQQVKALIGEGCEVKVISPIPLAPWPLKLLKKKWRDYAAIPTCDRIDGVEVIYPPYLEFPRSFLLEHSGYFMFRGIRHTLKDIFKQSKFDLIHAHVAIPDGHAAKLLRKKYQIPLVITIHGQDFQSTIHRGKRCRQRLFQVLKEADKVITVSSKLKNIVIKEKFFDKITVINNGIDLTLCQSVQSGLETQTQKQTQLQTERQIKIKTLEDSNKGQVKKIVSVSNLKKTKGIDLNLDALAILLQKYKALHYTIVGEGEERHNLESRVDELNLREHVTFLGRLPHSQALGEMANADIFSLPSWQEGFGMVYIEAMAQKIPVIGTQGEGIEDVIKSGHNGLLVKPHQIEDLVRALDTLLSDEVYASKLAQRGQETVLQTCSWQQNAKKTVSIYEELFRV